MSLCIRLRPGAPAPRLSVRPRALGCRLMHPPQATARIPLLLSAGLHPGCHELQKQAARSPRASARRSRGPSRPCGAESRGPQSRLWQPSGRSAPTTRVFRDAPHARNPPARAAANPGHRRGCAAAERPSWYRLLRDLSSDPIRYAVREGMAVPTTLRPSVRPRWPTSGAGCKCIAMPRFTPGPPP